MNISEVKNKCTGCTACEHICPKNAIKMVYSKDGFLYPEIDKALCIACGKCNRVCPTYSVNSNVRLKAYSGYVTDKDIVKRSSSGGAFSLMAENILSKNGIVFGAAFDSGIKEVVYTSTDDVPLDALRRSKYVASNPRATFVQIKNELKKGRYVLFCGLPCHVNGLINFLGEDYENLITCDFVCGGSASAGFFKEHLDYLEKKYSSKVSAVNFRAKIYGWQEHSIKICFENGKEYKCHAKCDSFFKGYLEKPFQRDCCYECMYRTIHAGDVIIADYWGGVKDASNSNEGLSMIITNSNKGDNFIADILNDDNSCFENISIEKTDYAFKEETERYEKGKEKKKNFLLLYDELGFEKAAKKSYFKDVNKEKIKIIIKLLLGKLKEV